MLGKPIAIDRSRLGTVPKGLLALVIDANAGVGRIMADGLRLLRPASVEVAHSYDEALDTIGISGRMPRLVWASLDDGEQQAQRVLAVLRDHRAPIHVQLYGSADAGEVTPRGGYIGAAGYAGRPFSLGALLDEVLDRLRAGYSVRAILESGRVPRCLDLAEGLALYGARPGRAFTWPRP